MLATMNEKSLAASESHKSLSATLVNVACPFCETTEQDIVHLFDQTGLGIVRCPVCGLTYTSPRLDPEHRDDFVYTREYFHGKGEQGRGGAFAERAPIFRQKWRRDLLPLLSARCRGTRRLLDVGCAIGLLVDEARKAGWDAVGIESSDWAASYARQELGLDVRTQTLETCSFAPGSFDAVCLMSVLEHLDDPVAGLRRVHDLLVPGGVVVIEVPDVESRPARRQGRNWPGLCPKEHLTHFSRATLEAVVSRAGFKVESSRSSGGAGILDAMNRPGLRTLRAVLLGQVHHLEPLRRLVRGIKARVSGASSIMVIARKPGGLATDPDRQGGRGS